MVSNTGLSSPGDDEITPSTSDVAVCRSSDFAQFGQEPRVLDGDHGLRGEILDELDLLVGEGADLAAVDAE